MTEMNREDEELIEMFNGSDKPMHPDTLHITLGKPTAKAETKKQAHPAKNETEKEKPVNAQWEPVKPEPNWLDNLKACVKCVGLFAGLCALVFYWQQTGQMEPSAAVPSMCACAALAGFGCGKNAMRGANR